MNKENGLRPKEKLIHRLFPFKIELKRRNTPTPELLDSPMGLILAKYFSGWEFFRHDSTSTHHYVTYRTRRKG